MQAFSVAKNGISWHAKTILIPLSLKHHCFGLIILRLRQVQAWEWEWKWEKESEWWKKVNQVTNARVVMWCVYSAVLTRHSIMVKHKTRRVIVLDIWCCSHHSAQSKNMNQLYQPKVSHSWIITCQTFQIASPVYSQLQWRNELVSHWRNGRGYDFWDQTSYQKFTDGFSMANPASSVKQSGMNILQGKTFHQLSAKRFWYESPDWLINHQLKSMVMWEQLEDWRGSWQRKFS